MCDSAAAAVAAAVEQPLLAVDASCSYCSCSSSADVAEQFAFVAAVPAELVAVPAVAVAHSAADFETDQSPVAEGFADWAAEAATREVAEVVVVPAFVV